MNNELSSFLNKCINEYAFTPAEFSRGTVESTGDGVAHIRGLKNVQYGELLRFENDSLGMALEITEDITGAVLFDNRNITADSFVQGTGEAVKMPVGECMLGRVVDPLGRPLDGESLNAENFLPVERNAPAIIDRRPVDTPLQTGILAIDSMIPIGRGQRELIIGDRQTGKTAIALDTIINQNSTGVICIYCAIGQKLSTVSGVIDTLKKAGAMEHTVIVSATASDSPALQYLAPYSACAVAESFEEAGRDVLIVYDDLSKHAVAYRTMSLLLLRPPGREAYPGDIFYLHSRLLERSACLSKEKGGGSITALPIIETMAGNISAYIPTNVISITDGQIYLEAEYFHSGIRPAVNTGLSVSRVGRAAQYPAMRSVSGTLRIDLSQYREMSVFTSFGSDIDESTKNMLKKGETLVNIFKQGKNAPYSLFDEVALLVAYSENTFADTNEKEFSAEIKKLLSYLGSVLYETKAHINETGRMDDSEKQEIINALKQYKSGETV